MTSLLNRLNWALVGAVGSSVVAIALAVAALAGIYSSPSASTAGFGPVEDSVDLGKVSQDEVDAKFTMVNGLDRQVTITRIVASCSCTEAQASTMEVGPGENTDVRFTWNTKGRRGRSAIGIVVHFLVSGETRIRNTSVVVSADVEPRYDVEPQQIVFGSGHPGVVRLGVTHRQQGADLMVTSFVSNHPAVAVSRVADSRLDVTFDPTRWDPEAGVEPYVTIKVDVPSEPMLKIPVRIDKPK